MPGNAGRPSIQPQSSAACMVTTAVPLCQLGLPGAHALAAHLVRKSASLRRLGVASNAMGSDGFALLHAAAADSSQVPGAMRGLIHLDCAQNGIARFVDPFMARDRLKLVRDSLRRLSSKGAHAVQL